MRMRTHSPTFSSPPTCGGRTRNCQAAASTARAMFDPRGDSSSATQSSTRNCGTVRHAIRPQPGPDAVER